MKRRIDICRKCEKFCHNDNSMTCFASYDVMEHFLHYVSENLAIPKDFFFGEEDVEKQGINEDFNEKDVPDDCIMKTEYFLSEWNERNENGYS